MPLSTVTVSPWLGPGHRPRPGGAGSAGSCATRRWPGQRRLGGACPQYIAVTTISYILHTYIYTNSILIKVCPHLSLRLPSAGAAPPRSLCSQSPATTDELEGPTSTPTGTPSAGLAGPPSTRRRVWGAGGRGPGRGELGYPWAWVSRSDGWHLFGLGHGRATPDDIIDGQCRL